MVYFLIDYSKNIISIMSLMCPLRIVFICNIEIGNSNWLLCNTVAVSEMNLFACETISFHNSFVCESNLYQMCQYEQNVLVFMKMFFLLFGYRSCHDTIHVPVYQVVVFFTRHFIFLWNFNWKQSHALAHIVTLVFFVLKLWHCCCVFIFYFR